MPRETRWRKLTIKVSINFNDILAKTVLNAVRKQLTY